MFSNFLVYFISLLPILNPSILLLPLFFSKIGLLLLYLLKANLLPLFLLKAGLSSNLIIFNIEVNEATILLKL